MVTVITIEEYRKMLNDYESPDEQIVKRLQYIEALSRNIVGFELENYARRTQGQRRSENA